jgi:hypothetical protein
VVTKKKRTAYKSSIPPAQSRALPQSADSLNKREHSRLLRNDAQVAAMVLNASRGNAAHKRLEAIRIGLEELRGTAAKLQEISTGIDEEMFPNGMQGPSRSGTKRHLELAAQYKEVAADLNKRHIAINDQLARYAFRPSVSYLMATDDWRFGMVPDTKRKQFEMKLGTYTITEADAVMAMVRLDAIGQLRQVKLCEQCKSEWRVLREIDRFCSETCRVAFYADSPEQLNRKAANQRRYRQKLKLAEASGLA